MTGKDRILEVLQLLKSNVYWQRSLSIESLALMVQSYHPIYNNNLMQLLFGVVP